MTVLKLTGQRETIGLAEELRNIALSAVVADQC